MIRKYVVLFGTLFNDVKIVRLDTTHNINTSIAVPLTYGPREKVLARLQQDPALSRMPAIQLPRMTFELIQFEYDGARKQHSTGRLAVPNQDSVAFQYVPVPYNFEFTLSILTKNVDDAWRIVEQIIPFFTPEFTVRAQLVPALEDIRDIPVILNSTPLTDVYENDFQERRVIMIDLNFTMKGWMYGPTRVGGVITQANTNFFDSSLFDDINDSINVVTELETVSVTPGQLANGSPTSNAEATVDRNSVAANSDFGYVIAITTPSPVLPVEEVEVPVIIPDPSLDFSIANNSMYILLT